MVISKVMETGEARRFTCGDAKDESPRWSPDGRQIALVSDRAKRGTPQVYLQHLAAVEQLRREGLADEGVAITGSSYGGYLSSYAVGHSDQVRVAVVCAPVANMESHFGTSDSGYYADAYSTDGEPDEQRELLARLSPMTTVEKVRTPTLFLQGADDERCLRGQSEELFVKLRRAGGAPTEMVLYPGGSHHVFGTGKPRHRLDIQHRIVEWLERWVDQPLKPLDEPRMDLLPVDQRQRQDRRMAGWDRTPPAKVPSCRQLLDQALDAAFPASDPIATSAAMHVHEPHTTPRDCRDWTLKPGARPPVGQPCDGGAGSPRSGRCAAELTETLEMANRRVPTGPCELEQSANAATLPWREGRRQRRTGINVEALQSLLAGGQLRRPDAA